MAYKRVTGEERRLIYRWRQDGESVREMGRRLGRTASSITREVARNMGGRGYRPKQAHGKAQMRAMRPGPRRFTEEVRGDAESRLREGGPPRSSVNAPDWRGVRRYARRRSTSTSTPTPRRAATCGRISRALGASVIGVAHGTMDGGEGRSRTNA